MVARITTPIPAAPAPSPDVERMGYGLVRFTISDALSMVAQGILPEDSTVELLNGSLVYRDRFDLRGGEIVEGSSHNLCVSLLTGLAARVDGPHRHLRVQSTLVCSQGHAPIPDGAVLTGTPRDYAGRLPTAADAFSVIEVADSSYERDAGVKLAGYAGAGVQQYIIINLRNRTAEVYAGPDVQAGAFPPPVIVAAEDRLSLRVGPEEFLDLPLADLLP